MDLSKRWKFSKRFAFEGGRGGSQYRNYRIDCKMMVSWGPREPRMAFITNKDRKDLKMYSKT